MWGDSTEQHGSPVGSMDLDERSGSRYEWFVADIQTRIPEASTGGTTSAARAADVLLEFGASTRPLGVSEVARATGLSKAVAHRILTTFVERGLLVHEARRYRIGPAAATLGARALDHSPLRRAAREPITALQHLTRETVTVSAWIPGGRVYVDQIESSNEIKMRVEIGRRYPLHSGSSGRAILAFLPEDEQAATLEGPLPAITPATLTDPDALREQLHRDRRHGVSHSRGERQPGAGSLAAPVFGATGSVVGSISICGPIDRLTDEVRRGFEEPLLSTAHAVSRRLGSTPPANS